MQESAENLETTRNIRSLRIGEYKPTFWLFNACSQIIYGAKCDAIPYVPLNKEIITFEDGGTGVLTYGPIHHSYNDKEDLPILIILPGLTGGV
jgi:predicted alpha/beta-fold hydrolase